MIKALWRKLFPVKVITRTIEVPEYNPIAGMVTTNGRIYVLTKHGRLLEANINLADNITIREIAHLNLA